MRWRWRCSKGHVAMVGVDMGAGDDETVDVLLEDGRVIDIKRTRAR